jgi:hypothetical protein
MSKPATPPASAFSAPAPAPASGAAPGGDGTSETAAPLTQREGESDLDFAQRLRDDEAVKQSPGFKATELQKAVQKKLEEQAAATREEEEKANVAKKKRKKEFPKNGGAAVLSEGPSLTDLLKNSRHLDKRIAGINAGEIEVTEEQLRPPSRPVHQVPDEQKPTKPPVKAWEPNK